MARRRPLPAHALPHPRPRAALLKFPQRLRSNLAAWRQLTQDQNLLNTIEKGLRLEFHSPPPRRSHSPVFSGTPEQKQHLLSQLQQWLEEGVIEPTTSTPKLLSLLFPVPKPGPKRFRWVLDLRKLNQSLKPRRFKMTGVYYARHLLQRRDWLTSIDLSDAFLHVPLSRRSMRYLAFRALDKTYWFRAMIFGLSPAPYVFTKLMKPVLARLRQLGIRCMAYMDDLLIAARTAEQATRDTQVARSLLENLGLTINLDKSEFTPTQQLQFLGFQFNTVDWTMRVPRDKMHQMQQAARRLFREDEAGTLTVRRVAGLAGKLVANAPALRALDFRRRSLHRLIEYGLRAGRGDWEAAVSLSRTARRDLAWLASPALWRCAPTIIRSAALRSAPVITTDASFSGWGATLLLRPRRPDQLPRIIRAHGFWRRSLVSSVTSINELEAMAVVRAWEAFRPHLYLRPDSEIVFESDNTTTVSYLSKWGGRLARIGRILEPMQDEMIKMRLHPVAVHLPGEENREADRLSRLRESARNEWRLSPTAFEMIRAHFGQPTMDWFASPSTALVRRFATRFPDTRAAVIDAFRADWSSEILGIAVPPFNVIDRVVAKAIEEQAAMIVVVPRWPTRPFWSALVSHASAWLDLGPALQASATAHPMRDGRSPPLVAFRLLSPSDRSLGWN